MLKSVRFFIFIQIHNRYPSLGKIRLIDAKIYIYMDVYIEGIMYQGLFLNTFNTDVDYSRHSVFL